MIYFNSLYLQSSVEGPKRIPVSQRSHTAVVTPTPHQRVLTVSNGPQRIRRSGVPQKPIPQVSAAIKSTHLSDQNVNPTPQPKPASQQYNPKMVANTTNLELPRPPAESSKEEKPQSKCELKKSSSYWPWIFWYWTFRPFFIDKTPMNDSTDASASKYVWWLIFTVCSQKSKTHVVYNHGIFVLTQEKVEPGKFWHWSSFRKGQIW